MSIELPPIREGGELKPFRFDSTSNPKHWDILITKPDGSLAAEREHGKDWNIPDAEYAFKVLFESIEKIRIECSKYCYESDKAKQERDKAEAENVKLREALKKVNDLCVNTAMTEEEFNCVMDLKDLARKLLETKP